MAQNKNQHFVPKVYLRQFCQADESSINLYAISADKLVNGASIKHQCSRKYFYGTDEALEEFVQFFEGQYGIVLSSLMNGEVTEAQLDTLMRFLVLQILRTPHMLEQRTAAFKAFKATEIAGKTLEEHGSADFDSFSASREMQHQIYIAARENSVLSDLQVSILLNETKDPFFTSDNPAFCLNRLYAQRYRDETSGLIQSGLIAGIPLTSRLMLFAYDADVYTAIGKGHVHTIKNSTDVRRMNEIQVQMATNTLFFENWAEREYVRFMARKFADFRRKTWLHPWTGIEVGAENGLTKYRKVRPEDAGSKAARISGISPILPQPSSWPSFLHFRMRPFGYTNGATVGFVRASEQARSPQKALRKVLLPNSIPLSQTAVGREAIWEKTKI